MQAENSDRFGKLFGDGVADRGFLTTLFALSGLAFYADVPVGQFVDPFRKEAVAFEAKQMLNTLIANERW